MTAHLTLLTLSPTDHYGLAGGLFPRLSLHIRRYTWHWCFNCFPQASEQIRDADLTIHLSLVDKPLEWGSKLGAAGSLDHGNLWDGKLGSRFQSYGTISSAISPPRHTATSISLAVRQDGKCQWAHLASSAPAKAPPRWHVSTLVGGLESTNFQQDGEGHAKAKHRSRQGKGESNKKSPIPESNVRFMWLIDSCFFFSSSSSNPLSSSPSISAPWKRTVPRVRSTSVARRRFACSISIKVQRQLQIWDPHLEVAPSPLSQPQEPTPLSTPRLQKITKLLPPTTVMSHQWNLLLLISVLFSVLLSRGPIVMTSVPQTESSTKQWVDGPMPLVTTPAYATKKTDIFTTGSTHMALLHNAIIRGYNTIWLQATHVQDQDKADFVGYCLTWFHFVKSHHGDEEQNLFPKVEELLGDKDIWDVTHKEHESFLGGLGEFNTYLTTLSSPSDFSGTKLREIMTGFKEDFENHFHSEISTIAAFSEHPSCPKQGTPEGDAAALTFKTWGKSTVTKAGVVDVVPFFLLNLDATYEEGMWAGWPPIPAPIKWGMVNLVGAWHGGRWKFASCSGDSKPRELYALQFPEVEAAKA
ncbi:hypothetical protein MKZ38_000042 [Zalerion maritima]|uniref:Hemerythrin-like domain-containing protein n=1 Tax=Zalerion maritima TaxID=339359 RepID=A0AAD5RS20_9PEZI|nr:hypothetical protein MKZ38_000042 [Zalerion maritima]